MPRLQGKTWVILCPHPVRSHRANSIHIPSSASAFSRSRRLGKSRALVGSSPRQSTFVIGPDTHDAIYCRGHIEICCPGCACAMRLSWWCRVQVPNWSERRLGAIELTDASSGTINQNTTPAVLASSGCVSAQERRVLSPFCTEGDQQACFEL
jgi:hypothetical protein